MKQYGFFVDTSKCTGCKTCQVSCKDEKELDIGPKFRRIYEYTGGDWVKSDNVWIQNIFNYYISLACNHCTNPICAKVCPTGAMHKRLEDGLVIVDQSVCIGCRNCESACPYGAPQFDSHKKVMSKCDGCYMRVEQGLKPVCIESCPQRALDFDQINILHEKYGEGSQIAPLPSPHYTAPNLIIKAHPNAKPMGSRIGHLANSKEV